MKKLAMIMALVLALFGAVETQAETITYCDGLNGYAGTTDSSIDKVAPDTNKGTEYAYRATAYTSGNDVERRVVIAFGDLGTLTAGLVQSATLRMRYYSVVDNAANDGTPLTVSLDIHTLLRPWVEAQVTWDSRLTDNSWTTGGAWNSTGGYTFDNTYDMCSVVEDTVLATVGSTDGWLEWDVTGSLKEQLLAGKLYGWGIGSRPSAAHDGYVDFRTSEQVSGHRPELVVVIPEPATLCLLGIGGVGILVRRRRF